MKNFSILFVIFIIISVFPVFGADMKFIQVTDVLFSASDENSVESFQNLISDINKQQNTDFVVFTGNNISKSSEENLKGFLNCTKALKYPYYVMLGNKDVNKQKGLSKEEYFKILKKSVRAHKKIVSPNYVFEENGVVFIAADGSKEVIPSTIGYYKKDVLVWLEEQLNLYADKNVVILQHFPLVPPSQKENYNTYKADEYLKLLEKHKNVKAVISGHFGVNNEQTVNNILHISTSGAPSYRIIEILGYDTENPDLWSICR